jgi:hypothetical protein
VHSTPDGQHASPILPQAPALQPPLLHVPTPMPMKPVHALALATH